VPVAALCAGAGALLACCDLARARRCDGMRDVADACCFPDAGRFADPFRSARETVLGAGSAALLAAPRTIAVGRSPRGELTTPSTAKPP
jgi:hypothetical protein